MKILYVCHRLPFPPKRGGKIRPFNMIRHFSESGHEVTVASLSRSVEETVEGKGLREHCHRVLVEQISPTAANARMVASLPTSSPSSMGYFYSPPLFRRIGEAVEEEKFDLIFVHCSSVAQYVTRFKDVPRILDFGDMDSQKWLIYAGVRRFPLSLGYALEGRKLEREERALARQFDLCTCTTRAELQTLESYDAARATGWFPNGVDSEFFAPSNEGHDPGRICFVGRMDYFPNQQGMFWFCEQIWPVLRERHPALELDIVGADPPPAVRALGQIPGVTVTGSVPDVRPYVTRAALTVAPLTIARGTQNKVLESMAMEVPVVVSREAAGGVDAVAGEHMLVASTPRQYCDAVSSLIGNPSRREALARAAGNRARSHHNWGSSMKRLDGLVDRCLSDFRERAGGETR